MQAVGHLRLPSFVVVILNFSSRVLSLLVDILLCALAVCLATICLTTDKKVAFDDPVYSRKLVQSIIFQQHGDLLIVNCAVLIPIPGAIVLDSTLYSKGGCLAFRPTARLLLEATRKTS